MRDLLIRTQTIPLWIHVVVAGGIIALAAGVELAMGRLPWGVSGTPGLWSGDIWSEHNSQYLADPYTFTHVLHGVALYGLLAVAAGNLPSRLRGVIAVAAESLWEVLENSELVIQRYRAATIALNYYGDSVANSVSDIVACAVGFVVASRLPRRVAIIGFVLTEVLLALWIRDSLLLNILMLIRPIKAVRAWQLAR